MAAGKWCGYKRNRQILGHPLSYAVWEGHKEMVEFLLAKGMNPSAENKDGETPLHVVLEHLSFDSHDFVPGEQVGVTMKIEDLSYKLRPTSVNELSKAHRAYRGLR